MDSILLNRRLGKWEKKIYENLNTWDEEYPDGIPENELFNCATESYDGKKLRIVRKMNYKNLGDIEYEDRKYIKRTIDRLFEKKVIYKYNGRVRIRKIIEKKRRRYA